MEFCAFNLNSLIMQKTMLKSTLTCLLLLLFQSASWGQNLIHYWNFNDNSSVTTVTTVSQSLLTGATLTALPGGSSEINLGGTGQNFDVDNLNAQNGDLAGTHLRFNNPIGGALEFALPTTGFEDIVVKFATRRSGSGAGNQLWSYSTNSIDYTSFVTIMPNDGDPTLQTLDFTAISGVNDNPNFKLKVEFEQGNGGTVGNNRFDNFTVDGAVIGGLDTFPPTVTITPTDFSTNLAVTTQPTISFNESIRLINDDVINDTNIDAVVELRLNDASGALVAFDATYADNTITITPSSDLLNNQTYYVALLANTVEDLSDNVVASAVVNTFTTIAVQTEFQAGDLVFVAYRTNATSTEDEIAFITFVDIDPGTFITFTDSKYTSNAQAQCPNGIVWTVGADECITAGSVITIQTDALVSNKGTVTGSGFGLSSNGDQVIVYTGTAATPNYITALSSNGWVSDNTSCGGSLSMLPVGLVDGVNALNTSTAPGNVSGNAVNGYYNGTQSGTVSELKTAILNPANWVAVGGGTPAQTWPTWNFPTSIQVQSVAVLNNTTLEVTFNANVDVVSASNTANYTGVADLSSASVLDNVVTLTYGTPFAPATNYTLTISNVEDTSNQALVCPFNFEFSFNTTVAFSSNFIKVNEDAGTLDLVINLESPATASVDLVVKTAPFSTADSNDFTLSTQTLQFTGGSSLTQTITIPIIDGQRI